MPIRPENRARYPKDWKSTVVPRIRARSGNRCECTGQCGLDHGDRCQALNGEPHPTTGSKVVLTVMHLDHTPENNADANLLHGCQQCHNRYDAPMRRAGIQERARAQRNYASPRLGKSYRDAEYRKRLAQWTAQTKASEEINRWRINRARQLKEPRKSQFLASFGEG